MQFEKIDDIYLFQLKFSVVMDCWAELFMKIGGE